MILENYSQIWLGLGLTLRRKKMRVIRNKKLLGLNLKGKGGAEEVSLGVMGVGEGYWQERSYYRGIQITQDRGIWNFWLCMIKSDKGFLYCDIKYLTDWEWIEDSGVSYRRLEYSAPSIRKVLSFHSNNHILIAQGIIKRQFYSEIVSKDRIQKMKGTFIFLSYSNSWTNLKYFQNVKRQE